MTETIGYIGSILFALCALPQAIKSHKEGHADGLSWGMLGMWFWGEILCIIYVFLEMGWNGPLHLNYLFNFIILLYLIKLKIYKTANI